LERKLSTENPFPGEDSREKLIYFSGGKVYAALYSDGWVKVGRGRSPDGRISAHNATSKMRGAKLVKSCVSGELADPGNAEMELIGLCSRVGVNAHGREWFTGVDFDLIEKLISSKFSGDERASFIRKKVISDECVKANAKFDSIVNDHKKWATSLNHAETMLNIYRELGYDDERFTKTEKGYVPFMLDCSLALHAISLKDRALLYLRISIDPDGGIAYVKSVAKNLVEDYRAHGII
jgi:hypothetical protein